MKAGGESAGIEEIARRADGKGQPSWRRLPDHLHQITAESSPRSIPLPSAPPLLLSNLQGDCLGEGSPEWQLQLGIRPADLEGEAG